MNETGKDKTMIWNDKTQSYRGKTSDGKIVDVSGDEWAESVRDGIQAYVDNNENFEGTLEDFREKYPIRYENYENLTWAELDDPNMWAPLAGDNPNVEIINA